jgi:hypothetical protein
MQNKSDNEGFNQYFLLGLTEIPQSNAATLITTSNISQKYIRVREINKFVLD